jgi:two-component system response regulator FixJ
METSKLSALLTASAFWDQGVRALESTSREQVNRMKNQKHHLASSGVMQPPGTPGVCRTLYLVNPDPAVHQSVARLLPRNRYSLVLFASAESLLASVSEQDAGVLLLDMELEGMSGLELQAELRKRTITLKVIVLSGEGSVQRSVQAIKAGAVDFLETPCSHHQLLDSLELAFQLVDAEQEERLHREILEQRYRQLTPREREVMHHVVRGVPNRRLAAHLGVSERTVELHRARVMAKMEASSLPALVHIAYRCSNCRPEEVANTHASGPVRGLPRHRCHPEPLRVRR